MKLLLSPILFFLSLSIASAEETSLDSLKNWIALPQKERNPIKENEFANSPISKSEANEAKDDKGQRQEKHHHDGADYRRVCTPLVELREKEEGPEAEAPG